MLQEVSHAAGRGGSAQDLPQERQQGAGACAASTWRSTKASLFSIVGVRRSGLRKSTLLHLLGTLDRPDEGEHLAPRRAYRQPPPPISATGSATDVRLHLSVLPPAAGVEHAGKCAHTAHDFRVVLGSCLWRTARGAEEAGDRQLLEARRAGAPPTNTSARAVRRRDAAGAAIGAGRWSTTRASCWPTSRTGNPTPRRASRSRRSCANLKPGAGG